MSDLAHWVHRMMNYYNITNGDYLHREVRSLLESRDKRIKELERENAALNAQLMAVRREANKPVPATKSWESVHESD